MFVDFVELEITDTTDIAMFVLYIYLQLEIDSKGR